MPALAATFRREGWVCVPALLDEVTVRRLVRATEELEASAIDLVGDAVVRRVVFEVQSASGRKGEPAVAPGVLRKITFPSRRQRAFDRLRRHPGLLATLAECGLPSPVCLVDQVNLKPARVGTGFPFHQDARFVIGRTRDRILRHGGVNLVIALDRSDAGNGGFEVLGRTHLGGLRDFPYDASATNEAIFDETHRALVPLAPGDALFFHPHLAHGSGPNDSDRPRRMVTLWFAGG
jgi:phytanoyl-CoA hydroxylase